jgi:hydrogenase maturation protein HypF
VTEAARVRVCGVVQGVGFRPFVCNLARERSLTGWVNNTAEGVTIVVEGEGPEVERFAADVARLAPPMAVVQSVTVEPLAAEGFDSFEIRASEQVGDLTLVSPDIATCDACLAELRDPADRRYRYPFINCTNCGPRFTIIESLPYDRPATSMRDFEMCEACATEYADDRDRRFHAQPDACHECGPRLFWNVPGTATGYDWSPEVETSPRGHRDPDGERARTDAILATAAASLLDGGVLAIKGLGGFHLACDATNDEAVATLRERKRRWGKPLAVMVRDLEAARSLCEVGAQEADLLAGPVRPIVLLRRHEAAGGGPASGSIASAGRDPQGLGRSASLDNDTGPTADASTVATLAPSVAPGLAEIGVMLPYTPVHHLLLAEVGRPLVMTSGNLSDEPIATDNAETLQRLAPLADAFLLHDRPIRQRYDDSVVRVVCGRTEIVRRSRGYAPFPLKLPFSVNEHIFAAGPEQKNTFCLAREDFAFVSQHIGDMENAETLESYEQTLALYEEMFRVRPALVAYDLHPEYLSTKFALSLGLPAIGVQHHHAHIASVTAEHGISTPVVGLAYDGTGYGSDGTIWGGEVLLADWTGFTRIAHLRPVPMPGGAAAIRRPARMALGLLLGVDPGLLDHAGAEVLREALRPEELSTLPVLVERGINSPLTSSMGRLFDAVAALAGVRFDALYEGQAAIELEAVADPGETGAYAFGLTDGSPTLIDPEPVVRALLDDLAAGATAATVSARFHRAVVDVSVEIAHRTCVEADTRHVACSGGVFMNRILLSGVITGVEAGGLVALIHRDLPVNDGGISFGQAVIAWARRDTV